jgi:hypothetical protein
MLRVRMIGQGWLWKVTSLYSDLQSPVTVQNVWYYITREIR